MIFYIAITVICLLGYTFTSVYIEHSILSPVSRSRNQVFNLLGWLSFYIGLLAARFFLTQL